MEVEGHRAEPKHWAWDSEPCMSRCAVHTADSSDYLGWHSESHEGQTEEEAETHGC